MINFLFDDAMSGISDVKAIRNVIVAEAEDKGDLNGDVVILNGRSVEVARLSYDDDPYDGENVWPERFETLGENDDDDDDDDDWDFDYDPNQPIDDWDEEDDDDDDEI